MEKIKRSMNNSVKPRRQRKLVKLAPLHIKQKFMRSHLSKELRQKIKKRNLQVKKGDEVKVMRGQFKGKTGKVSKVQLKRIKVFVEGMDNIKKDGSKAPYPIHPSNLLITKLETEDKQRKKTMERK